MTSLIMYVTFWHFLTIVDTIMPKLCDIEERTCRTFDVLRRVPVTMVFQSAIIDALYKISLLTAHPHNAFVLRLQIM